jgi:hypothetical protein
MEDYILFKNSVNGSDLFKIRLTKIVDWASTYRNKNKKEWKLLSNNIICFQLKKIIEKDLLINTSETYIIKIFSKNNNTQIKGFIFEQSKLDKKFELKQPFIIVIYTIENFLDKSKRYQKIGYFDDFHGSEINQKSLDNTSDITHRSSNSPVSSKFSNNIKKNIGKIKTIYESDDDNDEDNNNIDDNDYSEEEKDDEENKEDHEKEKPSLPRILSEKIIQQYDPSLLHTPLRPKIIMNNWLLFDKNNINFSINIIRQRNIEENIEEYLNSLKIWNWEWDKIDERIKELRRFIPIYWHYMRYLTSNQLYFSNIFNFLKEKSKIDYFKDTDKMDDFAFINFYYFINMLSKCLKNNTTIHTVILTKADNVLSAWKEKTSLRNIVIKDANFISGIFGIILQSNQFIKNLTFIDCNQWNQITLINLKSALEKNISIVNLDLSNAVLQEKEIQVISEALKLNKSIKIINLSNNKMNLDITRKLFHFYESLKSNSSITEIKLSNALLIDELNVFFEALKVNKSVKNINLSFNSHLLSVPNFLKNLGEVLNKTIIESIDLSLLFMKNAGLKELVRSLKLNNNIKYINLSKNNITNDGFTYLFRALKQNKSILTIKCGGNEFGYQSFKALQLFLERNTTLLDIGIDSDEIKSLFSKNRKIGNQIRNRFIQLLLVLSRIIKKSV